jgi:hypothetical protein
MQWIQPGHDTDQLQVIFTAIMNFRFTYNKINLLTTWVTIGLQKCFWRLCSLLLYCT